MEPQELQVPLLSLFRPQAFLATLFLIYAFLKQSYIELKSNLDHLFFRQQFEFCLMAVAEEVHAILKALPQ